MWVIEINNNTNIWVFILTIGILCVKHMLFSVWTLEWGQQAVFEPAVKHGRAEWSAETQHLSRTWVSTSALSSARPFLSPTGHRQAVNSLPWWRAAQALYHSYPGHWEVSRKLMDDQATPVTWPVLLVLIKTYGIVTVKCKKVYYCIVWVHE